jgi:DUF4097 and DUF4098 domain-containing protein YvlB
VKYEFATPEPPRLRIAFASGDAVIETDESAETVVEVDADQDEFTVEQRGHEIVLEQRKKFGRGRSFDVRVRAPHGSDVEVELASADLRTRGRLGEARIRSASGDVELDAVAGRLDLTTASGDVVVRSASGGGSLRTASGDVRVVESGGRTSVATASGDLDVESIAEGALDVKTASGDVRIGIKQGSRFRVDARSLSGDTVSELEVLGVETTTEGPLVDLKAASMSGDIRIVRA